MKAIEREILLSFWKDHISYHSEKEPVIGQGIIRELRRHGYQVSPGTLYLVPARMYKREQGRPARRAASGQRVFAHQKVSRCTSSSERQCRGHYREVIFGDEENES
jgi:hypothetical protein